jgi:hypothetical protein
VMKRMQFETMGGRVAKIAAPTLVFFLSLAAPAFSETRVVNALPAAGRSSANTRVPKGVKVLAQVPLDGLPITRMYTQWEYGRNFLYIEHGSEQITTVDITKKQTPQIVNHEPATVEAARYQELAEGGTIEISSPWHVNTGIDNLGGRGMFSILESNDPDDSVLLQAFGREGSNLADRARSLIFFASPAQLLIVEDGRWKKMEYTIN